MFKRIWFLALAAMLNACASPGSKAPPPSEASAKFDLSTGITKESLHPYIGQHVVVTGYWDSRGKESGYVHGGGNSHCEIYIMATNNAMLTKQTQLENSMPDGSKVQVAGVLYFNNPPVVSGADGLQTPPPYLFFDVAQASVTLMD